MATSGLSPVCSFLFVMISLSLPADANIGAFCGAAKNVASVISKTLLTKRVLCVNKNNALIYRVGNDAFVCGKRCFLFSARRVRSMDFYVLPLGLGRCLHGMDVY